MNLNIKIDATAAITIDGKQYPVKIAGQGLPLLCIGTGTLDQRALSHEFKRHFRVYSSELYFDKRYTPDTVESLTIDKIIDDYSSMAEQLGLSSYFLFGFSAFGLIALEFAKKYPDRVRGIIMVGTPPNSNPTVGARNNAYFEQHAEPLRKSIEAERRAEIAQEDLSKLDFNARFKRLYIYRDAPRNWFKPDFDCSDIWKDIEVGKAMELLFAHLLPKLDVMQDLEQIQCPVFLAAGLSDYNCWPITWKEMNLPPHMTIVEFAESGHWPHYEEQAKFDAAILVWLKKLSLCPRQNHATR